ncbi:putative reverse transcriptase domain-containing protein [Tanacetum coccineum]
MVAATEPKTIQKVMQLAGTLTDEALRNRSIKKNHEKRGNRGEPSKDRNMRDDNKRTSIGNAIVATANPIRRDYTGQEETIRTKSWLLMRVRVMESKETMQEEGNSYWEHKRLARTQTSYEIEIASGQLVEIEKVIRGCKLEIEGHMFDINLIPFGSRSFDVIIRMDWLSDHKAEIIYHEKVVRIPLLDGKVLRVLGEKLEEKMRQLMSSKAKEKEQEEIVVVRDFPKVFLDDRSGLPPVREIEFRIKLIHGEMLVAKSPYHLAPFELEELSGQLKEL